ncbi:helix-turn-helix domain-containing protein [Neorhizobium galegae]|uniref:helix-turn-helix domain-containing protein n=1 Tax=Neorhizobium galegae TaxID=399 RepID=UPI0006222D17|nr:XRE family transcriptional regulator [Neorhizobium galegae]CDZ28732.1 Putative transmembrane protein [Neorhizobium galegae bv. officinalis]KAA9386179.1 XRE family transcriptional regulator [Neorhizobium galegae]KAB1113378.1 XRE family transcriptional regulator [Neorhizobium galegae]MCM2496332.1 XRE family transcriptional regulator [Neorhizobium galegae]MCQ1764383.1 XRE family transcriptional regulator [Neorhizobium galegae]
MERLVFENIFDVVTEDPIEAADLRFRSDLLTTLVAIFEDRKWKQTDIAKALDIPQPRVSELMRGKIQLFSADKLIGYLAKLGVRLKPSFSAEHKVICDVVEAA